ncbi:hypothetical protein ACJZ2D_006576 [Fusarium nematophilum]
MRDILRQHTGRISGPVRRKVAEIAFLQHHQQALKRRSEERDSTSNPESLGNALTRTFPKRLDAERMQTKLRRKQEGCPPFFSSSVWPSASSDPVRLRESSNEPAILFNFALRSTPQDETQRQSGLDEPSRQTNGQSLMIPFLPPENSSEARRWIFAIWMGNQRIWLFSNLALSWAGFGKAQLDMALFNGLELENDLWDDHGTHCQQFVYGPPFSTVLAYDILHLQGASIIAAAKAPAQPSTRQRPTKQDYPGIGSNGLS